MFLGEAYGASKLRSVVLQVRNSIVYNTLTLESRKLNLCNIKPTSMFWRIMAFQAFGKISCMLWRECGIKRDNTVSVEIIHHKNNFFSRWILSIDTFVWSNPAVLFAPEYLRISIQLTAQ